jgi:hypothetical protein
MNRYLVRVWAKFPQKSRVVHLSSKSRLNYPPMKESEIWVCVKAENREEAQQKAKILWELT